MTPYDMVAQENARLRAQVAELESEIACYRSLSKIEVEERQRQTLCANSRLSNHQAWMLLALYNSRRIISRHVLNDMMPRRDSTDEDRAVKVVDVMLVRIRDRVGDGAVQSVWGQGLLITPAGIAAVDKMLAGEFVDEKPRRARHSAKLTRADAVAIRAQRGMTTAKPIARQYGVSMATVYAIWRDVPRPNLPTGFAA